jgi:uncharacterized protein (TIGR03084 family)
MSFLDDLLADLATEGDHLRSVVAGLDEAGWATSTPAPGWSVATQVAHLLWTDEAATAAARAHLDPEPWETLVRAARTDPAGFVDAGAAELETLPPSELLARWDAARSRLVEALHAVPAGTKMPWFGTSMAASSMATARFMETWAHSLDVHEALALEVEETDRVKHVAHLGVRTRAHSFASRGRAAPAAEVRVVLTAPSGETWTWGSDDAPESVTGSALDFARLVTQRVHRADTDLVATGPGADAWLDVAQCFAGPPGAGRPAS